MVALPLALNFGGSGSPQPMDTDIVSIRISMALSFLLSLLSIFPPNSLCTVASAPVIVQMYISPNWTRHVIIVVLLLSVHLAETICLFLLSLPLLTFFPLHCIYLFLCTSPFFLSILYFLRQD
jgi:hypothetical protein